MNRLLLLLILIGMGQAASAQYIYTIKADSVKITNTCDTAELIIENHTQTVPGFLYNKGRGRTEFRRGAIALDDSLYVIGDDTINLYKGRVSVTASNGLTATNNHIKLGGELSEPTDLWFNADPEWGGSNKSGQFNFWSTDGNGQLSISDGYSADLSSYVGMKMRFTTWAPNKSTDLQFNPGYVQISAGTGSVQRRFKLDSVGMHVVSSSLDIGFGDGKPQSVGNALLHLNAGSSFSGGAPLKFTAGDMLTILENGAVEFDGNDLYFTEQAVRYKLAKVLDGQITTNFGGPSLSGFNSLSTTLTVVGALPGDVVNVSANTGAVNPPSIIVTAFVTSANTVTLQAYNASNSAVTMATDTYKVRVIK